MDFADREPSQVMNDSQEGTILEEEEPLPQEEPSPELPVKREPLWQQAAGTLILFGIVLGILKLGIWGIDSLKTPWQFRELALAWFYGFVGFSLFGFTLYMFATGRSGPLTSFFTLAATLCLSWILYPHIAQP